MTHSLLQVELTKKKNIEALTCKPIYASTLSLKNIHVDVSFTDLLSIKHIIIIQEIIFVQLC